MSITLAQEEREIATLAGKTLRLSTHRVRFERQRSGAGDLRSIMLDQVSSCSVGYRSEPILLILSGLCALLCFAVAGSGRQDSRVLIAAGLIGAGFFDVLYIFTRRLSLTISAKRDAIVVPLKPGAFIEASAFIETLETAKNGRYNSAGAPGASRTPAV